MCKNCPFVRLTKQFKGSFNNTLVNLNSSHNCTSSNVVYCVNCNKDRCQQIYVGYTERKLKVRFGEHKSSVNTKKHNAIGDHFNGSGHSVANMNILLLGKVFNPGVKIIEKRESFWINKLEAEYLGLNRKTWKLLSFRFRSPSSKSNLVTCNYTWWCYSNYNKMHSV